LNGSQVAAANSEYQKILTETDTINNNTEYNGIATFAKNSAFTVSNASDVVNIGPGGAGISNVTYGSQTLQLGGTAAGIGSTSGVIASGGAGKYTLGATDTISTIATQINSQFGANVASVQGSQLILSGGAKVANTTVQLPSFGAVLTVSNANDIIKPGSAGFTAAGMTGTSLGGNFAAGGSGGNLAALLTAIQANGGAGGIVGNVLTLTTGTITGFTTATESGAGITSLTDKVAIPVSGVGSISTLTVGNANDTITPGTNSLQVTATGGSAVSFAAGSAFVGGGAGGNLSSLASAINSQFGSSGVNATISDNTLKITGGALSQVTAATTSELESANTATNKTVAIFTSDGTISQSYNNSASDLVQASSSALQLAGTDLTSTAGAQAALTAINNAITSVAAARGTIGANINTLTAVGNVMTTQSTNTLAAMNDVTATDYGQATSDMSKYQILSQTGIAALSQANQAQQLITKLLQ
jgi:flagellin